MSEPNTVGGRLREKSEAFVVKLHSSGKSDMWKNFSLVFEKRPDVHDSASCDFYVLWMGLRVGSQNVDPRATVVRSDVPLPLHMYAAAVFASGQWLR